MPEKFNNFHQFLLGFFQAGDIVKGYLRILLRVNTGSRFGEIPHQPAAASAAFAHSAQNHPPNANDQDPGEKINEGRGPYRWLLLRLDIYFDLLGFQRLHQTGIANRRQMSGKHTDLLHRRLITNGGPGTFDRLLEFATHGLALDSDLADIIFFQFTLKATVTDFEGCFLLRGNRGDVEIIEGDNQGEDKKNLFPDIFAHSFSLKE